MGVRAAIAYNSNTSLETLFLLAGDAKNEVKNETNQNPVFLQHRAEQDGACEVGQQMPVEWLKQMYVK